MDRCRIAVWPQAHIAELESVAQAQAYTMEQVASPERQEAEESMIHPG
jgi:hypothetical protein